MGSARGDVLERSRKAVDEFKHHAWFLPPEACLMDVFAHVSPDTIDWFMATIVPLIRLEHVRKLVEAYDASLKKEVDRG